MDRTACPVCSRPSPGHGYRIDYRGAVPPSMLAATTLHYFCDDCVEALSMSFGPRPVLDSRADDEDVCLIGGEVACGPGCPHDPTDFDAAVKERGL